MRAPRPATRALAIPRPAAAFVPLLGALWAAFALATLVGLLVR